MCDICGSRIVQTRKMVKRKRQHSTRLVDLGRYHHGIEAEWKVNAYLLLVLTLLLLLCTLLLLALALLEQSLRHQNLVLGWHGPKFQTCQSTRKHPRVLAGRRSAAQSIAGSHAFSAEHSKECFDRRDAIMAGLVRQRLAVRETGAAVVLCQAVLPSSHSDVSLLTPCRTEVAGYALLEAGAGSTVLQLFTQRAIQCSMQRTS